MIGLYTTLVVVVIVSVVVAVAPAVLRPVGDVIAKSVLYPIGIIYHVDYSILRLPDDPSIGLYFDDTPPRSRFVKRFRDIFLEYRTYLLCVVYMDLTYCAYIYVAN